MFLHLGHILGWISVQLWLFFILYYCFGTFLSLAHFSSVILFFFYIFAMRGAL